MACDDRLTVCNLLLKIQKNSGYSNLALDGELRKNQAKNPSFVSKVFYGVIERKITLDYQISLYLDKPIEKIDSKIKCILRMGVYQLLYMDNIPDRAAIDESVKLSKKLNMPYASGFINAVLRKVASNGEVLPDGDNSTQYLSIKYSCPIWLVKSFLNSYGYKSTCDILKSSLGKKPVFIRINNVKTNKSELCNIFDEEGVKYSEIQDFPNSLVIEYSGDIRRLSSFERGCFYVEDLSSQICADRLGAQSSDRILDVCAAPGGKTFTLAQNLSDGEIISCDIHSHRVKLIEQGAERLGLSAVKPTVNDALKVKESFGEFDKILCDVPCSGFGVLGRKPEIKYKSFDEVADLPEIQLSILQNSFYYLKRGGTIIYSTCTLLERENSKVVKKFLKNNTDAVLVEQRVILPSEYGSDGFYYCVLKKE